jgi:ADP-ribose pyrophosphatase
MIKPWNFVNRTELLDHPRMQIVEDTVELPDGATIKYIREAPSKSSSVAVIAINEEDKILLQQEYSYPPNKIMYQLPGGAVEDGESIFDAANRELSE